MPLSRIVPAIVTACLFLASAQQIAPQQPTEIIVIAGNHSLHLTRSYSPTELRALLRKIAPDALAVENFPDWQEAGVQFHPGLPEAAVGMSWAAAARVPVYGAKNGDDVPGWQNQAGAVRRLRDSSSATVRSETYLNQLRNLMWFQARMAFEDTQSIVWTHSKDGVAQRARDRQGYTEAQQRWMQSQDDTVAQGIIALVQRHKPRRLTIIMGSDHYGPTRARLRDVPGLRVISTEAYLPLAAAELDAAWTSFDAGIILGANLDHAVARAAPHSRNHATTRNQLDRLIARAPDSAMTLYYLARWHMLFERWNQAEALLNRVRAGAAGADLRMPIAWQVRAPPLPTYRDLATFALANLHDLKGNHDAARPLYQELLELPRADLEPRIDVTMSFDMRAYVDSLLSSPYAGGRQEYGRMLDARRPLFWDSAPDPIPALVARRRGSMAAPSGQR